VIHQLATAIVTLISLLSCAQAWSQQYTFGVVPVRSVRLTAEYWNPILQYVSKKSGVALALATKKSSQDYSEAEARGEFDFVYNNHIFAPSHAAAGYRVIARPAGKALYSKIVVPDDSAIHSLAQLADLPLGFPNKNGFSGYAVPMAGLIKAGVTVKSSFFGNQEGVMEQLRAHAIPAAGVNSRVMEEYAERHKFNYRVLWASEAFLDIPIAAHPRLPEAKINAVRHALIGMANDKEGLKILTASAAIIGQAPPFGFVPAQDAEYKNQRDVYGIIWKHEGR
jgi:phosphonate transport system substrate-binding protein